MAKIANNTPQNAPHIEIWSIKLLYVTLTFSTWGASWKLIPSILSSTLSSLAFWVTLEFCSIKDSISRRVYYCLKNR